MPGREETPTENQRPGYALESEKGGEMGKNEGGGGGTLDDDRAEVLAHLEHRS